MLVRILSRLGLLEAEGLDVDEEEEGRVEGPAVAEGEARKRSDCNLVCVMNGWVNSEKVTSECETEFSVW